MQLVPYISDSEKGLDSGATFVDADTNAAVNANAAVEAGTHAQQLAVSRKIRVRIRQNALLAKLACKCIRQKDVALTLFKTIYLSHSSADKFLANHRWVAHELAHVRQFMTFGKIRFLWMYLLESLRKGYYQNKWEAQARAQEENPDILQDFYFEYQVEDASLLS